jgi:hypothetical protein
LRRRGYLPGLRLKPLKPIVQPGNGLAQSGNHPFLRRDSLVKGGIFGFELAKVFN